ncbi:hypothetical protein EJ110_NYTH16121 [Nymphaea thermarum]|nr:hypothetical protein EJ110_NYTH16121 [Nymphaea thermarum]
MQWSAAMSMGIAGRDRIAYINGRKIELNETNVAWDTWFLEDNQVKTWIVNSVSPEIQPLLLRKRSARDRAPAVFSSSASRRRLSGASRRLIGVSCRSTIVRYRPLAATPLVARRRPLPPIAARRLLVAAHRRPSRQPFSDCQSPPSASLRCLRLPQRRLCSSSIQSALFYTTAFSSKSTYSVYESTKNQMLTSPSIPPIDEAYSRLSRIPISASTVPDTTSAMLATRDRGGPFFARGRGGHGRGNTPSRPVCQFCHRIGHTVDKCWQKHDRPAFANQTVSTDSPEQPKPQHTASSSELRVDDIISQLRNLIGAPDPTTSTVTIAASASSSGMYSAYTVCPATDTTDWLIDSGASTHLCGDKAQFTSYVPTPPGEYPEHAPGPDINELDMPIAQRKGKRSCTLHPISGHLSMDRLTPTYRQFVKGLSAVALPQTPMDALSDPKWAATMQEEMDVLQSRGT